MSTKNRPDIERRAQDITDHLISYIEMGNGDWNPHAWEPLFTAVCVIGDDAREAGPYAVLIYQRYIAVAALFLSKFPNAENRYQLAHRIFEDGQSLVYYFRNMRGRDFTDEEHFLVRDAVMKISRTLEALVR
jgi:hypothetical protein